MLSSGAARTRLHPRLRRAGRGGAGGFDDRRNRHRLARLELALLLLEPELQRLEVLALGRLVAQLGQTLAAALPGPAGGFLVVEAVADVADVVEHDRVGRLGGFGG